MVAVNNLSVEFSARSLFKNISFTVNPGERVALVGKNGAGKSTLLKIIAGEQTPSSGNISLPNDFTVGYLPQEMKLTDHTSVIEEVKKAFVEKTQLENKLSSLQKEIADRNDYHSDSYLRLIDRADELTNIINLRYEENIEAEIEKTLLGLGFRIYDFNRPTSEFSGGWRMRIELAKILLRKPDLLLLDEPTNHLDINSIQWLEQFLTTKGVSVLLVSHDRAFLDNVTNRTIEITCGKIYDYRVSYTSFIKLRKDRIDQQTKAYENQQKMIADTKEFIEKFRYKATKAVQVQSRIKQLEKVVPIEIDEVDTTSVNFNFPPAERSGDFPLIIENLSKSYGRHEVLNGANLTVRRGEKIAFVGSNGEGKTTLVKCIMNETSYMGNLKIGHNIKVGYFAQNQAQTLDREKTVFETVDEVATGDIRTRLKDLLAAFLFRGEDIDKKVSILSGGEKTRLAMAKLLLEPVNFLILDEPTNHLDIRTKDVLKNAIKNFSGTVIIVSHDREFMDGLVEKVYEFGNGKVRENIGGIYEYLNNKKAESAKNRSSSLNREVSQKNKKPIQSAGLSFIERKERDKELRKAEKAVQKAEQNMENAEQLISSLESRLAEGETDIQLYSDYSDLKKQLDQLTDEWEIALDKLETLKKNYEKE